MRIHRGMESSSSRQTAAKKVIVSRKTRKRRKTAWDANVVLLQKFKKKFGHCLVAEEHDLEFPGLYQWTLSVRGNYHHQVRDGDTEKETNNKRPTLSPHKLALLEDLGFTWDRQSVMWDQKLKQLRDFHSLTGHCRVPANWAGGLGVWVRNQRREYRRWLQGQPTTLSEERRKALEALRFEWHKPHSEQWETRYQQLADFFRQHGHSNVPLQYAENVELGQWCMNQRTEYRKYCNEEPTALTEEKIQRLESLDFCWNVRDHKWQTMLERLKDFHQSHGHVNIPTTDTDNHDLRVWLIFQRYHYNRQQKMIQDGEKLPPGPLTEARISALETAIPDFAWKVRGVGGGPSSDDWAKLFDAIRDKGITPGMRPKAHWFEGMNPFATSVKQVWTEEDLLELWNQEEN
jgi:hypothetical protein